MKTALWLFLSGALLYSASLIVNAGVYRCIQPTGAMEFRDHPCGSNAEQQDFLPYVYQPTDPKSVQKKEKAVQKTQTRLQREEKRQARVAVAQAKKDKQAALRQKRRLERCAKTKDQITLTEKKLQFGCKSYRCETLKQQLSRYRQLEKQYCSP